MRYLIPTLCGGVVVFALAIPFLFESKKDDSGERETELFASLPSVPEVEVQTSVPAFGEIQDVRTRKNAFFEYLMPVVKAENAHIRRQRAQLQEIEQFYMQSGELAPGTETVLKELVDDYRIADDTDDINEIFTLLTRRIDTIPETLVLVQAANESGWGTSRFATEGLNFFGQWCFRKGCGLVPDQRIEDGNHEVAKFASMNASVRSYMRNINTHPAYLELRQIRERYRLEGDRAAADVLTQGLLSYSERRDEYVEELNAMIRVNRPLINEISSITLN